MRPEEEEGKKKIPRIVREAGVKREGSRRPRFLCFEEHKPIQCLHAKLNGGVLGAAKEWN